MPDLDVAAERHHQSAIGLRTQDPIEEPERSGFFLGERALDGVADVENDAESQRQIVVARKVLELCDRRLIVKDAKVVRREVLHQATVLVGDGELKPDFGDGAANGVSRRSGEIDVAHRRNVNRAAAPQRGYRNSLLATERSLTTPALRWSFPIRQMSCRSLLKPIRRFRQA